MTLGQLRGGSVKPVYRGVFTLLDDPTTLAVRARAALKLGGDDARLCETTGLALLGVEPLSDACKQTVHLWVPLTTSGPRMAGIRLHRNVLSLPSRRIRDVLIANPAECWLQCAQSLALDDLVVLADGLMRRQDPILFLRDLEGVVAGLGGTRGVRRARAALMLAREGTDSPMETVIRLALVRAGLPCPIVNHPIRGRRSYFLDMAYLTERVAVEYDGGGHAGDTSRMQKDQTRRRRIEDMGWRIITATAADLADPSDLVASVRKALNSSRSSN